MKTIMYVFVLFFVVAGMLDAQVPEMIQIEIQAISLRDAAIEGLLYFDGEEMRPMHAPTSHFHFPVRYNGSNPLTLFVEREEPEEGESPYRPVAQIMLPRGENAVVLLLNRDESRIRGTAIPLREQGFPIGSLLLLNLSGREIQMSFADEVYRLRNGHTQIIRPSVRERSAVPMIYRFADDEENISLVSSGWFYNPARRYFVFMFDNEGQVGMRSVTWFPNERVEE